MTHYTRRTRVSASQWWPPGDERHDATMAAQMEMIGRSIKIDGRLIWLAPGDWIVTGARGQKAVYSDAEFRERFEEGSEWCLIRSAILTTPTTGMSTVTCSVCEPRWRSDGDG